MADDMKMQIILESQNQTAPGFEEMNVAMEGFQKLISDVSKAFEDFTRGIDRSAKQAAEAIEGITKPVQEVAEQLTFDFESPAKQAEEQLSQIGEGLRTVTTAAEESASAVTNDFKKAAEESTKALEGIGKGTSGTKSNSSKDEGILGMSGQMNMMYAGMTLAGFAAPIILGFKEAIQTASEFDQEMRNVNTMMHLPEEQFDTMKEKVIGMTVGMDAVPYSAEQMAQALYETYSANVPLNESLSFTKTAAESAAAGMGTTHDSVLALTETIKSYGMAWGSVNHVSDLMFQTIKDGQTTFPELAQSIGTVASMAHTAGATLNELMAGYSTLTGVTGNTSEVTTQLSGIFKEIVHPSKQAAEEAKKLGIDFSATALQSEGFAKFLEIVKDKTGGNIETLSKLFPEVRALRGILALTGTQMDVYKDKLDSMSHASDGAGQTAEALEQAMKGEADQFQLFKNHMAELGEQVNAVLLPVLNSLIPKIESVVGWFGKHQEVAKFAIEALAVSAGLAAILAPIAFAISGLGSIVSAINQVNKVLKGISLFSNLTNPFGWILLSVAVIGTAAVLIYQHWGQIKAFFESTWKAISNTTTSVWNGLSNFFKGLWAGITNSATAAWTSIGNYVVGSWQSIKTQATTTWNGISSFFTGIWEGIKSIFTSALTFLSPWFEMQWTVMSAVVTAVWETIKAYFTTVWDIIKVIFATAFLVIYDLITGKWDEIGKVFQFAGAKLESIITQFWNSIKTTWSSALNVIIVAVTSFWAGVVQAFNSAWDTLKAGASSGWESLKTSFAAGWENLKKSVAYAWDNIKKSFADAWVNLKTGADEAWINFKQSASDGMNNAWTSIKEVWISIVSWFESLPELALQWGKNLIQGFIDGIKSMVSAVSNAVSSVVQAAKNVIGFHSPAKEGPGSDADTWAPNLVNMFAGGILDGANAVTKAAEQMMKPLRDSMAAVMASGIGDMSMGVTGNIMHNVAIAGVGSGRGGSPIINVYVQGNIARNERELGQIVAREIWSQAKMQGKF